MFEKTERYDAGTFTAVVIASLFCLSTPAQALDLDLGPRPIFPPVDEARVELGRMLFYDPVLSGNQSISCSTCHHPDFGTSDGLSLGIGDGGIGLGPKRVLDPDNIPEQRIPRNAPALWNLGADEFTRLFHDGRLELDQTQPHGIRTPLGADMTEGFDSPLAAQAMFPVLAGDEMAGHYSENEISRAVRQGLMAQPGGAWDLIAERVENIPAYREAFAQALPDQDISFTSIANLMAEFMAFEWRADDAPFDRFMMGGEPLLPDAEAGMTLFYGKAGCAQCHSGWFQTDNLFHAIAMPQIGPGKSARFETHARDDGRLRVTGRPEDAFAFRTPSLRNVTLTAPYGHDGAYATLEGVIRHHLDPVASLRSYDIGNAVLPTFPEANDTRIMTSPDDIDAIAAANELQPVVLNDTEIAELIAFMKALEDPQVRLGVPESVPSGLPVSGP